ncbi:MAG: hypothetical protein KAW45_05350 [Thermoplasmatales archaeon]|nr:hypothetical protein [Thermoplasmatales archaeon]
MIILGVLLLPSIISIPLVQAAEEDESSSSLPFIRKLLQKRFEIGTKQYIGRWYVLQLRPPIPVQAYPASVDLQYINETKIEIGGIDPMTGNWTQMVRLANGWGWAWMSQSTTFSFEFVPPEDAPKDVWVVNFDPRTIIMSANKKNLDWPGAECLLRTNMTVKLNPSADPSYPTQDVVLKVNIIREEVFNPLVFLTPPTYPITHREEYLEKTKDDPRKWFYTPMDYINYTLFQGWGLILSNLQLEPYERRIDSIVNILVKVTKDHRAQILSPEPMEIRPYDVMSIPVTIKNIGSHTDTFNFRVKTTDKSFLVSAPSAITLEPGEEGQALIGVAAPKTFQAVGSTATINLEAFSVEDPNTVFNNTVILSTQGIHVSGGNIYNSIILLTFLVIFAIFFLIILRRRRGKVSEKPEKPWEIPKEKEHLEKLKKKDKKAYKKELQRMEEEYESALLWYKYYVSSKFKERNEDKLKQKQKRIKEAKKEKQKKIKEIEKAKKGKIQSKKAKAEEKAAKKEEKTPEIKEAEPEIEEIEPEEPEIEEETTPVVDEKEEMEKRKKEQVLLRIRREQEKQKRKFGK